LAGSRDADANVIPFEAARDAAQAMRLVPNTAHDTRTRRPVRHNVPLAHLIHRMNRPQSVMD
jgi:hypothetical protein